MDSRLMNVKGSKNSNVGKKKGSKNTATQLPSQVWKPAAVTPPPPVAGHHGSTLLLRSGKSSSFLRGPPDKGRSVQKAFQCSHGRIRPLLLVFLSPSHFLSSVFLHFTVFFSFFFFFSSRLICFLTSGTTWTTSELVTSCKASCLGRKEVMRQICFNYVNEFIRSCWVGGAGGGGFW